MASLFNLDILDWVVGGAGLVVEPNPQWGDNLPPELWNSGGQFPLPPVLEANPQWGDNLPPELWNSGGQFPLPPVPEANPQWGDNLPPELWNSGGQLRLSEYDASLDLSINPVALDQSDGNWVPDSGFETV